MEKRKSHRDISHSHRSWRKKSSRVTCPGCEQSFNKKYFDRWHKTRYFCDNSWVCSKRRNDDEMSYMDETHEDGTSDDSDNPVSLRAQLRSHIQKHVNTYMDKEDICESSEYDCTDDEMTEIWEDILEDDIDTDLGFNDDDTSTGESHSNLHMSLVLCLCLFVCTLQVTFALPDVVVAEVLRFLKNFFEILGEIHPVIASLTAVFPGSIYMLWKLLNVKKDNFRKYVVCKKCYSLYEPENCVRVLEGKLESARCTFVKFPNHPQPARRRQCGEVLMKHITLSNGKTKFYPYKTYCYKSIESTLRRLLRRPGFEESCEQWRNRCPDDVYMRDIYDGDMWKYFLEGQETGRFLQTPRNYCIMLNLDWFQPFKHVCYSVGVIYAVVLNLPRNERFKLENVILIGIIPDMGKEPSTNTFMKPLVDELLRSWDTGFSTKTFASPKQCVLFRLALICTGCDVPATRKLCGFLGHTARLGCSKCLKEFPGDVGNKDYSGFGNWEDRKIETHKELADKTRNAKTQTELSKLESEYGVRYSCLLALPYFNPIRMSIIDPMHNLYLGTAKHMIRMWQSFEVLTPEKFGKVQEKCDSIMTPATVGRLPRKISSSFGGFTAEQFMLWTNLFSLMTLPGIVERKYLSHWQTFVLASRILCSNMIRKTDLELFDRLMMSFCKTFESIFGKDLVTPNMHLHMHISKCVKDYGPVNGFWLFSFERYNGHLGSLPNNSRSVEIQIMRRFQRDNIIHSIELPENLKLKFSYSLARLLNMNSSNTHCESTTICEKNMSDFEDVTAYKMIKVSSSFLTEYEHTILTNMYKKVYPVVECTIPHSCNTAKALVRDKEIIGTSESRYKRSSQILANWNAGDGKIINEAVNEICAGIVTKIVSHNMIVNGESKVHILAKVDWYVPYRGLEEHCMSPVRPYVPSVFDTPGESSFMPVQIICSFIEMNDTIRGKSVKLVCPTRRVL